MKKDRKEYLEALVMLDEQRQDPSQDIIERIVDATDGRPMSKEANVALNKVKDMYEEADAALAKAFEDFLLDDLEEAADLDC